MGRVFPNLWDEQRAASLEAERGDLDRGCNSRSGRELHAAHTGRIAHLGVDQGPLAGALEGLDPRSRPGAQADQLQGKDLRLRV